MKLKKHIKFIPILIVALIIVCGMSVVLFHTKAMPEIDAYYHIRIAKIMQKTSLVLSSFPWTSNSIWASHFFDKEWLFHLILIPFLNLGFGEIIGAKIFLLLALLLCCLVWGGLLRQLKIKNIFLTLMLMFFATGPAFIGRLSFCRPHILSILLFGLLLIFLLKRNKVLLLILSYLYALSYTGSWHAIPVAILFDITMLCRSEEEHKWGKVLSFYVIAGVFLGMIINPYFPSNIFGLYVQNIAILKTAILGNSDFNINFGTELLPIDFDTLILLYMPIFILNIISFVSMLENKINTKQFRLKLFFGILSMIYMLLTMLISKFTDYSIPVIAVFIAFIWDTRIVRMEIKYLIYGLFFVLLTISAICSIVKIRKDVYDSDIPYRDVTQWIENHTKYNEEKLENPHGIVFTSRWDNTPYLFYLMPEHRYLTMLDPYFMYLYSPEKYRLWQKISEGKTLNPADLIKADFNSNIVVLDQSAAKLKYQLETSPLVFAYYNGKNGDSAFLIKDDEDMCNNENFKNNIRENPGDINMQKIRKSVVGNYFYSANKELLAKEIEKNLMETKKQLTEGDVVRAVILPHAGYAYSGKIAVSTLSEAMGHKYDRIIILAPSHYVNFEGISLPDYEECETPFGNIEVDTDAIFNIKKSNISADSLGAQEKEHALETQLPLIKYMFPNTKIVPIVCGCITCVESYQKVVDDLLPIVGDNSLIIVSSDFTHYGKKFNYLPFTNDVKENLKKLDYGAINQILDLNPMALDSYLNKTGDTICGSVPIELFLNMANEEYKKGDLKSKLLYYSTSGEMTGDYSHSVSYAGIVFYTSNSKENKNKNEPNTYTESEKNYMLNLAKNSIKNKLSTGMARGSETVDIPDYLQKKQSCFVTLHDKNGNLRGCIGNIMAFETLYDNIIHNSLNSAFSDTRFTPIRGEKELSDLNLEITILTPMKEVNSYKDIVLGRDGIYFKLKSHSAVFLPQVPIEEHWSLKETLSHLSMKAGLSQDAWMESDAKFYTFEGVTIK